MTSTWQLEVKIKAKKYCLDLKRNLREITMKYGRLVVSTRHDSAEIWGLRYEPTLGNGALKLWPAPLFSFV
jgi:hypothetical protein